MGVIRLLAKEAAQKSFLLPPKKRKKRRSTTVKAKNRKAVHNALHSNMTSNAQTPQTYGTKVKKKKK